jgi:hypothetical protein
VEDVRATRRVEHVGALEKASERLAVDAVADEAQAARWRDVVRDAAQALASTRDHRIVEFFDQVH